MFRKIAVAIKQNCKTEVLPVDSILQETTQSNDILCSSAEFFHIFGIGRLFRRYVTSAKGVPAFKILQFFFALAFRRKSFCEMMHEKSQLWGKDTFYRFLSLSRINWRYFSLSS